MLLFFLVESYVARLKVKKCIFLGHRHAEIKSRGPKFVARLSI